LEDTDTLRLNNRQGLRRFIGPKRATAALIFGALIAVGWWLRHSGLADPASLTVVIDEHPLSAPLAFVALYTLMTLTALPALPLNLAAGLFWGALLGGTLSAVGATLGAIVAFAAARLALGRPLAERFDNRLIAEIQREFAAKGWWFVAFMRINPIFPTGPLNYILGLTSIRARIYSVVTLLFLLPPSIAIALIGQSVGTFVVNGDVSERLRVILAASAAVTVLAALAFAANLVNRLRSNRG
jgi:uncharacterized membrane protein YdjX (TVP38/TMEM64 family)